LDEAEAWRHEVRADAMRAQTVAQVHNPVHGRPHEAPGSPAVHHEAVLTVKVDGFGVPLIAHYE